MERPSHIKFASHHFSHRLPLIGLALSFQAAALWLFMHGFSNYRIQNIIHDITVVAVPEKPTQERVKPPDPVLIKPKPVTAEKPIFETDRPPIDNKAIHADTDQKPVVVAVRPVVPDRGVVGITATHTVPPYPPIARRIGAEGKVTLRLTVTAEGRVSEADVVTSSGRDDLDQTAQQWIMAHWTYKPAMANGAPVVSKTLATVTFNLINER